jgi:uncharacterized Tic20 family protein
MVTRELPQPQSRTWVTLLHLFGVVGFFLPPLGVILPLIIWSALRHRDPEIDLEGRLALNFQLSMLLYLIAGGLLLLLMPGVVVVVFAAAADLYCGITATVHAARGDAYAYPLSLRFIPIDSRPHGLHAA